MEPHWETSVTPARWEDTDLTFSLPFYLSFPSLANFPFPSTVLPVLSPLHCRAGWRRCHRHRTGKLLMIPLIMCFSKYARCHGVIIRCLSNPASHVFQCVILPVEIQPCSLPPLHECVCRQGQCFTRPWRRTGLFYVQGNGDSKKSNKHLSRSWVGSPDSTLHCDVFQLTYSGGRNRYRIVFKKIRN